MRFFEILIVSYYMHCYIHSTRLLIFGGHTHARLAHSISLTLVFTYNMHWSGKFKSISNSFLLEKNTRKISHFFAKTSRVRQRQFTKKAIHSKPLSKLIQKNIYIDSNLLFKLKILQFSKYSKMKVRGK